MAEAEKAVKTLYGKERVAEVMGDLTTTGQGSTEPEAGWFDLFSSRYFKGIPELSLYFVCRGDIQHLKYYDRTFLKSLLLGLVCDVQ